MKTTLEYKTYPDHEGIDNTQTVEMADNISWEIRFYCDNCDIEIDELQAENHVCEESK